MIQRIQSIWLFLSGLSSGLMFFVPLATIVAGNSENRIDLYSLRFPLWIIILFATLIPMAGIFQFNNRKRQVTLSRLAIILNLIVTAVLFFVPLPGDATQSVKYAWGTLLSPLSILFLFLAIRGIKKDERLIRSVDRIR